MVNKKRSYESVIIISTKMEEDKIRQIIEKFKSLISEKAQLESVDEWGKKTLSYPIKYEKEGYYVLFNYKAEPGFAAELDRVYGITDGVMRSLIVSKEK